MEGVLNDHTRTVHRRAEERAALGAECGALRHVKGQSLETVTVDQAIEREEVKRCGRCFERAGGY